MASTVRPRRNVVTRSVTGDSAITSSPSKDASPFDSPEHSTSSTSLSSLASDSAGEKASQYGKLLDTYGNEFKLPEFTIKDIRDAIPAHCFERSALRGYGYILRDIALLSTTFYLFHNYATPEFVPNYYARVALWGVYTFLQGLYGTGLWVIAHECGHQSFSPSRFVNDLTGWVIHSALLVPYFSWKISHGKHHKATGHIERDMVFVPKTRSYYASLYGKLSDEICELMEETPIATALHLVGQQLVGWPLYIISNKTGHDHHEKQVEGRGKGKKNGFTDGVNHFNPSSPLYEYRDVKWIIASDIGLGLVATGLYFLIQKFGWQNMLVWYFLPYLWVNHWLGKFMSF
jgi:omega-6 fatty acid desaturase (delta-12 desaturase)